MTACATATTTCRRDHIAGHLEGVEPDGGDFEANALPADTAGSRYPSRRSPDAEHLVVQLQDLQRQEGGPDQGHAGRDDPQEDLPVVPRVLHRQGQA